MNPGRRGWLAALALAAASRPAAATGGVRRGRPIVLPRDHGAHVDSRTEWWYATGWLGPAHAPSHGFQLTFFRSRTGLAQDLPGRLAPRQLLFAHAALTDLSGPGSGAHLHAQQMVRWNGRFDAQARAAASSDDTRVWIDRWRLERREQAYHGHVESTEQATPWSLDLVLHPSQPVLLQGDAGFSRKGPQERQASHYYSQPQLLARGRVNVAGRRLDAEGRAWLDHEWSDEILAADAVGWDWIGFNLFDGGALTVFRLRRADGSVLWAGGSHRSAGGTLRSFGPDEPVWTPGRRWRSPATGADYPVQWQIDSPAGRHRVRALLDTQELDSRAGIGTVYWEGLSELLDGDGRRLGLGYLEMTGYSGRLRL